MPPRVGDFVRIQGDGRGIGKVMSVQGRAVDVSFFRSPAEGATELVRVAANVVKAEHLHEHTRVYWFDSVQSGWRVARVAENGFISGAQQGLAEDHYQVELPNKAGLRPIPVSVLQVRWDRPVTNPVDYLAARTIETPHFHGGRQAFFVNLAEQRRQCGALTGLWSAAVDLQAHQFDTVRTVLGDPVQRYLLADEVGLGKTIEAGAILRQYVLDEPLTHRAAIIVPSHLVEQWKAEIRTRFYLGKQLGSSILVVAEGDISTLLTSMPSPGMLIVDEAHHPAAYAFSAEAIERDSYRVLEHLARAAQRLLLLSATPVLRNEDGFLAMLHLLDPDAYSLDDRASFRRRVANRQRLSELLSDLQDDASSLFLEDALKQLSTLAAGDTVAETLAQDVRARLEDDEADEDRRRAIRALRVHVSEVYRLHRRLIRHRRDRVNDVLRGRRLDGVLSVAEPHRRRLGELLERWRDEANLAAKGAQIEDSPSAALYGVLLRGFLSHADVLVGLAQARLDRVAPEPSLCALTGAELDTLAIPAVFPDEHEILAEMVQVPGAGELPRVSGLRDVIVTAAQAGRRTLIFVDNPSIADRVANRLSAVLGHDVLRHRPGIDPMPELEAMTGPAVLVCDRRAEEGLNLQQFKAQIVHLDLPLAPGRIEQRIGRVDRFGAAHKAQSLVFSDPDPIAEAWRACLVDVIRVFDRSIASLQYVLEEHMEALPRRVFIRGVEAIQELIRTLSDGEHSLANEEKRIRVQDELDALAESSAGDRETFEAMESYDSESAAFRKALNSWATDNLKFEARQSQGQLDVVRYAYMRQHHGPRTLISVDEFIRYFASIVDPEAGGHALATIPLSFSRRRAQREGIQLLRIGHPFVDGLFESARRDDRGVAFAMWRFRPNLALSRDPFLAFGFDYLIEAGLPEPGAAELSAMVRGGATLRRRVDSLLPPHYATVWLDEDLQPLVDEDLLTVLGAEYRRVGTEGARDYNLRPDRWDRVAPLLEVGSWDGMCRQAEAQSEKVMKDRLGLDQLLREAERRLDGELNRTRSLLNARISRLDGPAAEAERRSLAAEEAISAQIRAALQRPRLTPVAAYAIILSRHNPMTGAP